jgi:Ca2+-binding RTX toxin-like protein
MAIINGTYLNDSDQRYNYTPGSFNLGGLTGYLDSQGWYVIAKSLTGTVGNDQIYGRGGHDLIKGNAGDDGLWGDEGDDTVYGENGNDSLYGGEGFDSLYGGDGNDYLEPTFRTLNCHRSKKPLK